MSVVWPSGKGTLKSVTYHAAHVC